MGEARSTFKVRTGKPTGKRPLGRSRPRWKSNIGIDPRGIDIKCELTQFRMGITGESL